MLQRNIAGVWIVRPREMMPIYTDTQDIAEAVRIGFEAAAGNAAIGEAGEYLGTKVAIKILATV